MPSTESLSDTLSKTLDIFASGRESHAPLTTSEVADSLDCTRRVAVERLERLVEQGHLETKEVADREHVWWLAEASGDAGRDENLRTVGDSDRMLARLIENVPGMIYRCRNERDWPMEFVSDGCRELTGYDPDALERDDVRWGADVIVEDDREEVWEEFQTITTDREQFSTTYRIRTADGELRWVRDHARGMFDEDGDLVAIEGIIYDVTERKRLESELDEFFGRVTDAFYALDDQWRFTHANERAEELIDYQGDGLVGKNFWEVFEWATDSTLGEEYRTAMETQEPTSFEFYYPDPLEAWYEIHAYPSETGLSVYFRDVTERTERERELERSERRYRALVENFPNGAVGLVDEDLHYRTVGGNPVDVADVTVEEVEGSPVREALPPELADELAPRYEAALEGESDSFEAEYDGRVFEFHVVPVRDDDGNVFAGLGMSWDITERKEGQRKLQRSERRYRTLVENFPNGSVALFDEDLCHTAVGGQLLDTLDISPTERLGRNISELHSDDVPEEIELYLRAALEGEENSFEIEYRDRHLSAYTLPVTDDEGDAFAGMLMVRDVTERKERERELERALDLLERTERIADVGGWEIDPDTQDVFWTDHIFELLEVPGDEEPPLDEALDMYHEEDQPIVEEAVESALASGDPFDVEVRVRTDSGEIRWLRLQGVPETDDDGIVSFRGAAQDVTEQVEREQELEETVEQLEEANDRLERFASMLAHELRNPVTIGQIYSQQLPAETDSGPDGSNSEAVEYVTEAFDRIEDMIDVMLVLTRGREAVGDSSPLSLADVTRDAWEEIDAPDATLEVEAGAVMQADETYVRHMFRNLFENAVQHGGTDVTVRVGELPTGFYVADDGRGIPAEDRGVVFEAGYTTAGDEGGTGLGLAFVEELADVYGWDCDVTESEAGGAQFEFRNVDSVTEE